MQNPAELVIANRTTDRARELVDDFLDIGRIQFCGFDSLPAHAFDLIINATSAGLSGEVPSISAAAIGAGTVCYDMTYGKDVTPFVRWAREHGCGRAEQGLGMLVEQAAESFLVWRGLRPEHRAGACRARAAALAQRIVTNSSALVGWIATVSSKSRLRRTHAHRHRKALKHFVRARSDDVRADDALLRTDGDELHVGHGLAGHHRIVERHEARHEHLDVVPVTLSRLDLAQSRPSPIGG